MKLLATEKAEQNEAAIDPWTLVHFSAGLALGLMDTSLRRALGLALTYEASEQVFERHKLGRAFFDTQRPESLPNAVMDVVALAAGHRLGQLWNRTARDGSTPGPG